MAVLGAFRGQLSQNHLRVVNKVTVKGKALFRLAKLHPCGLNVCRTVALLQKNNVADHICTSVGAESVVRQADGSQQIGALGHVFASSTVFAVQCEAAGHKGDDAARTYLVDSFGKKVVMDGKAQLVVCLIIDLVLAERNIADGKVIEIPAVSSLKASNCNVGLRVKHFCDSARDGV